MYRVVVVGKLLFLSVICSLILVSCGGLNRNQHPTVPAEDTLTIQTIQTIRVLEVGYGNGRVGFEAIRVQSTGRDKNVSVSMFDQRGRSMNVANVDPQAFEEIKKLLHSKCLLRTPEVENYRHFHDGEVCYIYVSSPRGDELIHTWNNYPSKTFDEVKEKMTAFARILFAGGREVGVVQQTAPSADVERYWYSNAKSRRRCEY